MAITTDDSPPPYEGADAGQVALEITCAPSATGDQTTDVLVSIIPPPSPVVPAATDEKQPKQDEKKRVLAARAPVDICLVIDVSGSMSTAAPAPGEGSCSSGLSGVRTRS